MLHILLTILKVIGILLLVILALLVLLVLIVLFVPLRYRIHVRKEGCPLEADGMVSWLLKILRVTVRYREKSGLAQIWVLRFRIKSIAIPDHGKTEGSSGSRSEPEAPEAEGRGKSSEAVKPMETKPSETAKPADAKPMETKPSGDVKLEEAESSASPGRTQPSSKIRKILEILPEKAVAILDKICSLVLRLIDLPLDLYDKADDAIDAVEKKIRAIRYKAEPFLSIEAEHMLRKLIGYLLYLIRGWKPRRVEGYLEFGTGHPDQTGKLTGLLCLLLPEGSDRFELRPDFYEKRFLTDITISGQILFYRLAVISFKLLIDREFWALLRLIRHKPPRGKKQNRKSDSGNHTRRKNHG